MKKKIIVIIVALCIIAAYTPEYSRAAISPHFIAINDTLLPFNDDTMPYVGEGSILVPYNILSMVDIWAIISAGFDQVQLHKGSKRVYFTIDENIIMDQDGNTLNWPSPQRIRGRYYVPLHQICAYFDLAYELIEVGRDVIPNTQIWLIRIITNASLSRSEFIAMYRNDMVSAYNEYYRLSPSQPPGFEPPVEEEEPPPDYSGVTIHLSFYDISAGGAESILDILESDAASGYPSCFFINSGDIIKNPGFIRMLYGAGYMIGIWLDKGTYEEYLATSALLYEAAKIKTVLVSAGDAEETAIRTANAHGLIYWGDLRRIEIEDDAQDGDEAEPVDSNAAVDEDDEAALESTLMATLPTNDGERGNLMQDCSEVTATILPEVLLVLQLYNYSVQKITETVPTVVRDEGVGK